MDRGPRYALFLGATQIADWTSYLSVLAEVAATLTGLVFVAVSINLASILATPGLTARAAESVSQLFGAVLIATSALIPSQPIAAFGVEACVVGAALWLGHTILQVRYWRRKTGHPRRWAITRIIQTQLSNLPFCVAGVLLMLGSPAHAIHWLALGFAFSLISGVASAWVLLIEIRR